jgi:phosphatidylserine decarboxylase
VLDVFCENKRSVMTIRRHPTGAKIAVVAVGAMLVGSIFYTEGVEQKGATIRRGQCLGGFKYGGSVCLQVLFGHSKLTYIDRDSIVSAWGSDTG